MKVVSVVLKQNSKYIDKEFDYLAHDEIEIGSSVNVPFGKSNKLYFGIVTNIKEKNSDIDNLKSIKNIIEKNYISKYKIELAYWIKNEYMSSLYEALNLFVMPKTNNSKSYETYIKPIIPIELIDSIIENEKSNSKNKKMILSLLKNGEVNISILQKQLNKSLSYIIKKLEKDSIITIEKRYKRRIPESKYLIEKKEIIFTEEQKNVLNNIRTNIKNNNPILLHGVTGSGKTEIYIELIKDCIKNKKQSIILVPEISLTPQTISRFKNIFGNRIGVFHSKISQREKEDQINLILEGKIDIVIGARSALFVPFDNLGIIIIDEAHDDAYKSEQSPKYDAIEVAEKLCRDNNIGLVLGTATPTISQYYYALNNRYHLEKLQKRTNNNFIDIEIIDTFEDLLIDEKKIFNDKVLNAISNEIENKNQIIVFLNKRGFSTSLSCSFCNHTVMCKKCDISLTYHKEGNRLLCHYCGYEEKPKLKCEKCGNKYVYYGYGTQKIEEELLKKIKNAKVSRLDKDTITKKNSYEEILNDFKNKKTNILIGTQMISKGLDFDKVSLVVVLNADQGLRFPDYRSYEKTFNLLLQISGRTGRGNNKGKVMIQTGDSKNQIFELIKTQNYEEFYNKQIKEREDFLYPPFSTLIKIKSSSNDFIKAAETTQKIKDAVNFYANQKGLKLNVLGPVQNFIKKIDNKFNWQIFYKINDLNNVILLKKIINFILTEKRSIIVGKDVSISIEINPKTLI